MLSFPFLFDFLHSCSNLHTMLMNFSFAKTPRFKLAGRKKGDFPLFATNKTRNDFRLLKSFLVLFVKKISHSLMLLYFSVESGSCLHFSSSSTGRLTGLHCGASGKNPTSQGFHCNIAGTHINHTGKWRGFITVPQNTTNTSNCINYAHALKDNNLV